MALAGSAVELVDDHGVPLGRVHRQVALEREPATIVDLLSMDEGADIEFEPERLGLVARTPEL